MTALQSIPMKLISSTLLTAALLTSSLSAGTVSLSNSWSEFDWNQTNPTAPNAGILSLSGQSSTGFTATTGPNTLAGSPGRPRVFQTFTPQTLAAVGDNVSLSFKLTSANGMVAGDSAFRFALADTSRNHGIWASIDFGPVVTGNASTTRFDGSITDPLVSASYVAGNFGHFLNSGGTKGGSADIPNGTGFGDPTTLSTVHSLSLSVTRVVGGLSWTYSWGNDAGAATTVVTIGATFDDSITQANGANGVVSSMDGIAFVLSNDAPYGPGNTGSYTVSDVVVSGVNAIPEPASAGLLLLGTLLTVGRRRRQ